MNLHANAALSLCKRRRLCERVVNDGWAVSAAAETGEVSVRCAYKWVNRYRLFGEIGLRDRSCAPRRIPHRTSDQRIEAIKALRRLRFTGPEISEVLGTPVSTVGRILKNAGMGKLPPVNKSEGIPVRYERQTPGELVHIDVKKLPKIRNGAGKRITGKRNRAKDRAKGWERVHIAIDDCTRLAYAEVLNDEKATTTVAFLKRACTFYKNHGVTVQAIMTDNGPNYISSIHTIACRTTGIKHLRTRPYRPQTNGKAERFIQTLTRGWAHGAIYKNSQQRTKALNGWIHEYNHHRKHTALDRNPPINRLHQRHQPTEK